MDLEKVKHYIDLAIKENNNFKLLGGEPTDYPYFKEVLEYIQENKVREFLLVTNLLFKEDIRNLLKEFTIKNRNVISFLLNSTDLEFSDRMKRFEENIDAISASKNNITLGITLDASKTVEYYKDYLKKYIYPLRNKVSSRFRLSIAFPGEGEDKDYHRVVNNKEYGNMFYEVYKDLNENGYNISVDCVTFPCMFTDQQRDYIKRVSEKKDMRNLHICKNPAIDVFADGSVSYCYPTKWIKEEMGQSVYEVNTKVDMQYYKFEKKAKKPKECLTCNFYLDKVCKGPCLAFEVK